MTGSSTGRRAKLSAMANPEELRKQDRRLPKQRRKYPQSRVTQALYLLLALLVIAWLISLVR